MKVNLPVQFLVKLSRSIVLPLFIAGAFGAGSLIVLPILVAAQVFTEGVAHRINLVSDTGFNGALVCFKDGGFNLCADEYDPHMYAVQTDSPAAQFEVSNSTEGVLVQAQGIVQVAVSGIAGQIIAGDYVTSSTTPGVAQKAGRNGFVIGNALESFSEEGRGSISVALKIGPVTTLGNTRSNLVTVLQNASNASEISPLDSFRYLIAALMSLISFGIGFTYFGKMSKTGVEAIGRNPLATKQIQFNVLLHVGVALLIVGVGLGVAYMILVI